MESPIQYINNQLAVPAKWFYEPYRIGDAEMPAIMKLKKYDSLIRTKKMRTAWHPGPNKPAMILFESIREENIKMLINARVGGNVYKAAKRNLIERYMEGDIKAALFYSQYQKPDGSGLTHEKQMTYTTNACIFNLFTAIFNNRKSMQWKHLGKTNGQLWESLVEILRTLNKEQYPYDLPLNVRALERKYIEYKNESYIALVHGGMGNTNGLKTKEEQQTDFMNTLLSNKSNFDNVQIENLYNQTARLMGWPEVSDGTVANRRKEYELYISGGQRGLNNFRNTKTMQLTRKAPECALYYCTVDGWDAELLYQREVIDDEGKSKRTYHNRLTIVTVLDACCKYPVGYAIGTHENIALIEEALGNAMQHIKELFGELYRPIQMQSDNYAKASLTPVYKEMAGKYYTPARVGNAKAKVIEPYQKYLNKNYCQLMPNWNGFGITSKKSSQPNSEWLNANRKNFPDKAGCEAQLHSIMQAERQKKIGKYREAFNRLPAEHKMVMNQEDYLYWFGQKTGYTNRLQGQGLLVTIGGEQRKYECFNPKFRELSHIDWVVHFSQNDLTKALAVSKNGEHKYLLEEKYIQPMALIERKDGDAEELQKVREFNKVLETSVMDFNEKNRRSAERLYRENPQLNDTLGKHIIADSLGQHKDAKNELRITNDELRIKTEKLAAKQERKEVKKAVKVFAEEQEDYLKAKVNIDDFI